MLLLLLLLYVINIILMALYYDANTKIVTITDQLLYQIK